MVLQGRRREWQAVLAFFGKEVNVFVRNFSVERRFTAPAGKQLVHGAGIKQRAGKRMLAELTCLFQDVDVFFAQRRFRIAAVWRSISWDKRSAQASPAGPPPTMVTSDSICGRSTPSRGLRKVSIDSN